MFKYIILIAVDVIAVIGIIAVFMSVKRSRGHRSLRNPAPRRWGWSIASGKQQTADIVKDSEDKAISTVHFQTGNRRNSGVFALRGLNGFANYAERRTRRQTVLWLLQLSEMQ